MPSRQQISTTPLDERDEWRTPPWLFRWLDSRFCFDIDLAASKENALCDRYLTKADDCMDGRYWASTGCKWGWCNPPYSNVSPWLYHAELASLYGFSTALLVPSPNGELYFGSYVFGRASEVIFISGRISFLRPDGSPKQGNRAGSCIVIYDAHLRSRPTCYWHVERDFIERQGRKIA